MWDVPFEEYMLKSDVIIHCPDGSLADELMEIIERHDIEWEWEQPPTENSEWERYGEETCYWVEHGVLQYGSRDFAEEDPSDEFGDYIKCTFCGANYVAGTSDFEAATDDELAAFLGIGGGL